MGSTAIGAIRALCRSKVLGKVGDYIDSWEPPVTRLAPLGRVGHFNGPGMATTHTRMSH
jgi:hypothetical protein